MLKREKHSADGVADSSLDGSNTTQADRAEAPPGNPVASPVSSTQIGRQDDCKSDDALVVKRRVVREVEGSAVSHGQTVTVRALTRRRAQPTGRGRRQRLRIVMGLLARLQHLHGPETLPMQRQRFRCNEKRLLVRGTLL